MRTARLLQLAVLAMSLSRGAAFADIAFPARLEIAEIEPGTFHVTFTLPIVEGRKLRAEPDMPPTCRDGSPREVSVSSAGHTTTWISHCEPASLAGEAILVQGLLGTQTDLALTLTTLDGRVFSEILRASRPGFLVPEPPAIPALARAAGAAGMRRTLRQLPLWLLLVTATLLGAPWRTLAAGAAAFAVGHWLGQWLGGNGWLAVTLPQRDLFVLATVAVPAIALAGGGESWRGWVRRLWPVTALLGLLYGGALPEALPPNGLSDVEQVLALALFAAGVTLGLLLMSAAAVELDTLLRLAVAGRARRRTIRCLGYAIGALATGLLLAGLVAMAMLAAGGRGPQLELALLAAVLGPSLVATGRGGVGAVALFAALAGVGVAAGLLRLSLPLGSTLVVGTMVLLGAMLAANRPLPGFWVPLLGAVAVPTHAWFVSQGLVENVSRSTGTAVGAAALATCVLYASLEVSRDRLGVSADESAGRRGAARPSNLGIRLLGAGVVVLALASRLQAYRAWFDRQLATEAALGIVRLPALALLLVVTAVLVWPRRRRVLVELGIDRPPRMAHWLMLGGAWLLLPYGTVAVHNPFFEPHAPRGEDARRVVSQVLSDTYRAFNLSDEDELYDTLSESVTSDLVDDLYLDSRRRLTAGTRQGTQVTVRDVSVLDIGEPEGDASGGLFAYDCRWVVTARVQHLQHVHHRRNVYNGVLALRVDGERWKIARVELHGEKREVVPFTPS